MFPVPNTGNSAGLTFFAGKTTVSTMTLEHASRSSKYTIQSVQKREKKLNNISYEHVKKPTRIPPKVSPLISRACFFACAQCLGRSGLRN
jgi:hypothetical protein